MNYFISNQLKEDKMSIEEIMSLELEGLSATINDYCRENYILSYTRKLQTLSYPEDYVYINKLAKRLLDWYEHNIQQINESKFITNKAEHIKSISLLETIVEQTEK